MVKQFFIFYSNKKIHNNNQIHDNNKIHGDYRLQMITVILSSTSKNDLATCCGLSRRNDVLVFNFQNQLLSVGYVFILRPSLSAVFTVLCYYTRQKLTRLISNYTREQYMFNLKC